MGYNLKSLNTSAAKKVMKAMVYTDIHIYWGELIVDENQLPERLLTGAFIPDNVCLVNNKFINSKHMGTGKPKAVKKTYIPTQKIVGFHLMDIEEEDFIPEGNRIKKEVIVLLGNFKITASMWIGSKIDLHKHLELSKSEFMEIYDVSISIPEKPELKPINAKTMSVRKNGIVFLVE